MKIDAGLMGPLADVPARIRELEEQGFDGVVSAETSSDPFFPAHKSEIVGGGHFYTDAIRGSGQALGHVFPHLQIEGVEPGILRQYCSINV